MRRIVMVALVGLLIFATFGPVSVAWAKGGEVVKTGGCSGSATWKLKLSPDNGRIEVEFQVDSNKAGQTWRVKLFHDGTLFFTRLRATKAPSGSFEVRRMTGNAAGADTIKGRARNIKSGQLCVGKATFGT
jgi:hypothetical protein